MKRLIFILLPVVFFANAFRTSNKHVVEGVIKDANGNGIAYATIIEKARNLKLNSNAATSDHNGFYRIEVSNRDVTLVINSAGYESQEIMVKGRNTINVTLKPSKIALDEVVVTSFASRRSKSILYNQPQNISINLGNYPQKFNTEDYDHISENSFHKVSDEPLSTFSIDVDAASYSNVRRFLNNNQLPPAGAVRIEEMINYFRYDYAGPKDNHPFSISTEMSECPWNKQHKLVLIGLQGKRIPTDKLPPSNLVFLIDVSGSMSGENRLPLVKSSLKLLVDQLRPEDQISIVVYAGAAGLVLPSTSGNNKSKITSAIDGLEAGGSTAGGEGIKLAYKVAQENFMTKGNNRVILCTDGDFNVGVSSDDDLVRIIEKQRESGVYLTILGYGMGNYKDNKMQKLADKGNGNHAYIDRLSEAKKVLVNEFGGTLFTIAKDVKLQIEFNPVKVEGYRLIGYENRILNKEDFNDDKKDAGELGSGHTVTALYEIIPAGVKSHHLKDVDPLKYQNVVTHRSSKNTDDLLTIKFRYKAPAKDNSALIEHSVVDNNTPYNQSSNNYRFAASVAEFGMLLRNSELKGTANYSDVYKRAKSALGNDNEGYRKEFLLLIRKAAVLTKNEVPEDLAVNE